MVANAITHRSYLDDSCVQVSIFDDRVEVLSPGMLYGGLDLETAKVGKSRCRNAAIAEAFHYMHIVEARGTGIPSTSFNNYLTVLLAYFADSTTPQASA